MRSKWSLICRAFLNSMRNDIFWFRSNWHRKEFDMSVESLSFFKREVKWRFTTPWSIGPTKAYHIVLSKRELSRKRAKFKRVAKKPQFGHLDLIKTFFSFCHSSLLARRCERSWLSEIPILEACASRSFFRWFPVSLFSLTTPGKFCEVDITRNNCSCRLIGQQSIRVYVHLCTDSNTAPNNMVNGVGTGMRFVPRIGKYAKKSYRESSLDNTH